MSIFRLSNNVPDVYVKQSRDFQLMCNLFDLMNNGVKFDIDTISSLSDTLTCRDSMMTYLQHKLGFYMDAGATDETIRMILKCFPFIVKKKGSKAGIIAALCLFLTAMHSDGEQSVSIVNVNPTSPDKVAGNYIIAMTVETNKVEHADVLDQLMRYILPAGYKISYDFVTAVDKLKINTCGRDEIRIVVVSDTSGSVVRAVNQQVNKQPEVIGAPGTTLILSGKYEDSCETHETHISGYKEYPELKEENV